MVALPTRAAAPASPQGTISGRYFLNTGAGTTIADLTNHVSFPDSPGIIRYEPYFEAWAGGDINTPAPSDVRNAYGSQLVGYFYPATTGDYVFFLAADDTAVLFLSTDDSPDNKRLIAQETVWSNPREYELSGGASVLESKRSDQFTGSQWPTPNQISLQAGRAYYIEALAKEGGGGDNLSVSIDGALPIPGDRLSPFAPSAAARILAQPQDATAYDGSIAQFFVGLELPPGTTLTSIEWQKNGVAIPDSNTTDLSLPLTAADNDATIRAVVTTSTGTLTSEEATVSVATLTTEFAQGVVKFEAYRDIGGGVAVFDLVSSDKYIAGTPDDVRLLGSLNWPDAGYADNYGAKVSGFIIPPETGSYRFFIRADDAAELWLSQTTNEADAVLIASEAVTCCEAFKEPDDTLAPDFETSAPQNLQGGTRYAFYLLFKEGGGGDWFQVAARREGDSTPATALTPLSGTWIGANVKPSLGEPQITTQPQSFPQLLQGRTAELRVDAAVVPTGFGFPLLVQWQKDGQDLAGATSLTYTITNASDAASGTYRAVLTAPSGASVTTADATVTVIPDTIPPKITRAGAGSVQAVIVTFDEPLDETSAETAANYTISDGINVTGATLSGTSSNIVRLTTSSMTVSNSYTLTVGGVRDVYGNAVPAGTQAPFIARVVTYADVILSDRPIAFYRFEETTGQTTQNYGTLGSAADGLYKVGNGPEDSIPTNATVAEGPRPGEFLGFDPANRAVIMDGLNTTLWIDTQQQMLNNLSAFSLEYWVKPANRVSDPDTFGNRIGLVGQNDAVEYGFINPTTIQIWSAGGGALDTTYTFPDNEWHHVATIADGTSIKTYYDGQLIGTGGTQTSNYGSSTFNVNIGGGGVYDATGNFFTGQFDEVAIFDRAIPADRIAAHFRAGKEGGELPDEPEPGDSDFSISYSGGQVTIAWEGAGTLEEAPSVTGPWTSAASQANPQTVAPTGESKFYRLRQ